MATTKDDQAKVADDQAAKAQIEKEKQQVSGDGEYRVVCAGLQYRLPSADHATEFAMRNAHINLDATEAQRLMALDCIVPKGEPDPTPMLVVSNNPDNPFGGVPQVSLAEHARRITAEQHEKAAIAGAVQAAD